MRFLPTSLVLAALATTVAFVGCAPAKDADSNNEDGGESGNGGNGNTGNGGNGNGGTGATAGTSPNGGANGGGTGPNGGGGGVSGNTTGGVGAQGGTPTGGASGVGNTGGTPPTGGASGTGTGGANGGVGGQGGTGTGGAMGGKAGAAGAGPDVDQMGKMNARPGSMTSTARDYLRMGEIRLLNNNWGSAELGCTAPMSVFIDANRSFGWTFNRGNCDASNSGQNPDFPQVEFGMHPFGVGNALATSPNFSSTTLLPLQIRQITSASVNVQNLQIQLTRGGSWNITFEFWLSSQNPNTQGNAGVHTELMTFWGWQNGRWPSAPGAEGSQDGGSGTGQMVNAGQNYTLWVQRDNWADGWRYFQFRAPSSSMSFNGSVNVKTLLDYLVNTRGFSPDLWVTRLEVGSEIDDETEGRVTMSNITFEVNGQSRSPVFGQ
jgi:hypothetical protein